MRIGKYSPDPPHARPGPRMVFTWNLKEGNDIVAWIAKRWRARGQEMPAKLAFKVKVMPTDGVCRLRAGPAGKGMYDLAAAYDTRGKHTGWKVEAYEWGGLPAMAEFPDFRATWTTWTQVAIGPGILRVVIPPADKRLPPKNDRAWSEERARQGTLALVTTVRSRLAQLPMPQPAAKAETVK